MLERKRFGFSILIKQTLLYYPPLENDGPLAQLVEQWTFNPFVTGSIPVRPTIFSLTKIIDIFFYPHHFFHTQYPCVKF